MPAFCCFLLSNQEDQTGGGYLTPEEAYEAYCKAAKELHGEFANFGDK